ncbi:7473_t:CDS:2 [Scutellospora calospora]|uniref:7473_t:CDS:1 n=1 Tax=Scutellospora calospora TaxID=85575 RepID=A0ACA9K2M3_9GLOM|nr:7473_t:CDS:2 [Scutellospora calospora]
MEKLDKANYFYFIPPEGKSSVEYIDMPELESSPIRTEWLDSNNKTELLNKYYKNYVQPFKEKSTEMEYFISNDPVRKQRIFPSDQLRKVIANQRMWNVKYPRERFPLDNNIYDRFLDTFSRGSITDFNPEDYGLVPSDISTIKSTSTNDQEIRILPETTDHQSINGSERSHEKKKEKDEHQMIF